MFLVLNYIIYIYTYIYIEILFSNIFYFTIITTSYERIYSMTRSHALAASLCWTAASFSAMAPKAKDIAPEKDGSWIGKYPEKGTRCLKNANWPKTFYLFLLINCVFQNVWRKNHPWSFLKLRKAIKKTKISENNVKIIEHK